MRESNQCGMSLSNREVTDAATLALHEALPRVSDAMAAQRIEAAIGLLDQSLSRTLDLEAWLSHPE